MRDWDSEFVVPSVLHLHRKHSSRAARAAASERGGICIPPRRGAIAADYGGFPIVVHTAWVTARWTARVTLLMLWCSLRAGALTRPDHISKGGLSAAEQVLVDAVNRHVDLLRREVVPRFDAQADAVHQRAANARLSLDTIIRTGNR